MKTKLTLGFIRKICGRGNPRALCGNVIKTRSTKQDRHRRHLQRVPSVLHRQQKFVDTAGRVDKFQQRAAKTAGRQAAAFATKKKKKV
jgi:ribosomal protein L31